MAGDGKRVSGALFRAGSAHELDQFIAGVRTDARANAGTTGILVRGWPQAIDPATSSAGAWPTMA